MTTTLTRRAARGAAAVLIASLLVGCGGDDDPAPASPTATSPTDTSQGTEDDADEAPEATSVALPDGFPESVRLVDGSVTSASMIGSAGWNVVMVPEASLDDVADEAQALLEADGFEVIGSSGENRNYRGNDFELFVNIDADAGTVSYTVLGQ